MPAHPRGGNSIFESHGKIRHDAFLSGLRGSRMKREPTKLECGLLGALLASIVLAFLFWLGIELSMLTYRARPPDRYRRDY